LWKGLDGALRNVRESWISRQVKHFLCLKLSGPKGPLMIRGWSMAGESPVKTT